MGCVNMDTAITWKLFIKAEKITLVSDSLYYCIKYVKSITLSKAKW